jgi:hypothetical protein
VAEGYRELFQQAAVPLVKRIASHLRACAASKSIRLFVVAAAFVCTVVSCAQAPVLNVPQMAPPAIKTAAPELDKIVEEYSRSPKYDALDAEINKSLVRHAQLLKNLKVPYVFGGKAGGRKGLDCSGFAYKITVFCAKEINKLTGKKIYHLGLIEETVSTGAAFQISKIEKKTGRLDEKDVRDGILPDGALIGLKRQETADEWAKGRPYDISHVVVVVTLTDPDGNDIKHVVESADSAGGMKFMPLDEWLKANIHNKLYAVDPHRLACPSLASRRKTPASLRKEGNSAKLFPERHMDGFDPKNGHALHHRHGFLPEKVC